MPKLRVALIGCGKIAQKYVEYLRNLSDIACLAAACDASPERAAEFAEAHSVSTYPSIATLLDDMSRAIDVFLVLTPSGSHAANICELAEGGARNVIVEKPIALTLEDAQQAIDACERHGCRLFTVKQWRYNWAVQYLRRSFEQGRFGRLSLLTSRLRWCRHQHYYDEARWRGTWAQDGGVLTNQACHAIDLLLWFGGEVHSVYAMCETRLARIETEDTAVAVIRFANGALGAMEATTAIRPGNLEASLSVLGSGGSVELDGMSVDRIKSWRFEHGEPDDELLKAVEPGDAAKLRAHTAYLREVFSCIQEERAGGVSGRDALASLRLIHALYHSERLGRPVELSGSEFTHSRLGRRDLLPELVSA